MSSPTRPSPPSSSAIHRRSFVRQTAAFGLAAGTHAILPGTVARAGDETTKKRDLVILQPSDITALDPLASIHTSDIAVKFNMFDTLVRRHPDGSLHPGLATAWKRTAATTWEFTLRDGVRWHDGARFSSLDARYSLERTYDATVKAARLSRHLDSIVRTEAPRPEALVIHTRHPDPLIPAKLAYCGQIVPWRYIDRVGFTVFNERPVGTGPLRFVSWTRGERCVLAANPDYWDGRLDVERVVLRPVAAPGTRVDALLRGDADLITRLPPEHAKRLATPATRVVSALYAGLYVLLLNAWVSPLNNPQVRKALSLATDREALVRLVWRGRGVVPTGPIPRGDDHYDESLAPLAYDPGAARDLLRRAGYRDEPVVVETTDGFIANDKAMTELIAEMWEDVGIKVVVEVIDQDVRLRKYRQQTLKGLAWSDPTSTTREPDGMMGRLFTPDSPHDYWRHPEFERLAAAARVAADHRVRDAAYRRMTAIFLEHTPWIIVVQPYEDYGLRRHVQFTPNQDQQLELRRFNFRMHRA
jgi:peptide/nickel transport system substrate-binding protein